MKRRRQAEIRSCRDRVMPSSIVYVAMCSTFVYTSYKAKILNMTQSICVFRLELFSFYSVRQRVYQDSRVYVCVRLALCSLTNNAISRKSIDDD